MIWAISGSRLANGLEWAARRRNPVLGRCWPAPASFGSVEASG